MDNIALAVMKSCARPIMTWRGRTRLANVRRALVSGLVAALVVAGIIANPAIPALAAGTPDAPAVVIGANVNRTGSGGGFHSRKDESRGSTEEVQRRVEGARDPDGAGRPPGPGLGDGGDQAGR